MSKDDVRLRTWAKLTYRSPSRVLEGFAQVQRTLPLHDLPYEVRALRTRGLKPFLEIRQAAILCEGMGRIIGTEVSFAQSEEADHDFIAAFRLGDTVHYIPVQLKELVPDHINADATLQSQIDKLKVKYRGACDLAVGIHVNRRIHLELSELDLTGLEVSELWLFGSGQPDGSEWFVVGNFLAGDLQTVRFIVPGYGTDSGRT